MREKRAQLAVAQAKIAQTIIDFFPKLSLRASYMRLSPSKTSLGGGGLVGAANNGPLEVSPTGEVLDSMGVPVVATAFDIRFIEDNYALTANLNIPLSDYVLRPGRCLGVGQFEPGSRALCAAGRTAQGADRRAGAVLPVGARTGTNLIAQRAVERTRSRLEDARAALSVGRLPTRTCCASKPRSPRPSSR